MIVLDVQEELVGLPQIKLYINQAYVLVGKVFFLADNQITTISVHPADLRMG